MALTTALNLALSGIGNAQSRIAVTAGNITNAETEGYTVKSLNSRLISTPFATYPTGGQIIGSRDPFLEAALISDGTIAAYDRTIADSLNLYQQNYGTTGGDTFTLSKAIDQLNSDMLALSLDPTDFNRKYTIIETAEILTTEIRSLEDAVQAQRQEAEYSIANKIEQLNTSLQAIHDLNDKIAQLGYTGDGNIGDLEDQRNLQLNQISELMDISYFYNDNNQLRIFTKTGMQILGSVPQTITFEPTSSINKDITYPSVINGIELNGLDITSTFNSGEIGALIDLRDNVYVEEVQKLDEISSQIITNVNAATNQGTSSPAVNSLTGTEENLSPATVVATTGFFRVTTTDANGIVQSTADIDLSLSGGTIGGLIAQINALPDVTAALNADNALVITAANPAHGVAFNELDSSVGPDSFGLSHFFGMNNLFTGTDSRDISINSALQSSPTNFPSGYLSAAPGLVVGDVGIAEMDNTAILAISDSFTAENISFNAAGNFTAQVTSLSEYANNILSNAATRANNAEIKATSTTIAYENTKTTLNNLTGVNTDEESAKLIQYENAFQSSSLVISTVRDLFDSLIAAVR